MALGLLTALFAATLLAGVAKAQSAPEGYIVTGKVTGGNLPVDHWGFAIARQTTQCVRVCWLVFCVCANPVSVTLLYIC